MEGHSTMKGLKNSHEKVFSHSFTQTMCQTAASNHKNESPGPGAGNGHGHLPLQTSSYRSKL